MRAFLLPFAAAANTVWLRLRAQGQNIQLPSARDTVAFIIAFCLTLAIFSFAVHAFGWLYEGHYSVTRQDFWRVYGLDLRLPFPQNALVKHNDHPVFFPSLIWLPILHYFENDQTLLFLVGCAITLATLSLWIVSLRRSPTLGLTHRLALGLLMTVSTLWLGKANITASGGFSAMNSLATTAVVAGLLALSFLRTAEGFKRIGLLALVMSSGLVATFSFATGLAAWPAYLLLAVFLRSGGRVACLLGASGLFAAVVFLLLPNDSKSEIGAGLGQIVFALPVLLLQFLQVLGSPWLHYASESAFDSSPPGWTYLISAFLGGLGLALAAWMAWRRYRAAREYEPAETVALGMAFFILGSIALIVIGRTGVMTVHPDDVFAPRYCFWSPFFWAALPVLALYSWARLRTFPSLFGLLALALTLGAIPSQVKIGQAYSQGRKDTETAALRLVCGAEDEASLQQLFRSDLFSAKIIHPLARIYRARGLDMFAWPGASLVGQRMPPSENLPSQLPGTIGHWKVDTILPPTLKGEPLARFSGWCMSRQSHSAADYVVIYQKDTKIVGLGWFTIPKPDRNRKHKVPAHRVLGFEGFIRNYSSTRHYECRPAIDGSLSWQDLRRIGLDAPPSQSRPR